MDASSRLDLAYPNLYEYEFASDGPSAPRPLTRQEVGQSLQYLAQRVSSAIQQTMSEKQQREYDQHTGYAIYVYPQLEARIVPVNRCDDNIEAAACFAAESSVTFDRRGDVLSSIYKHVQRILSETSSELLDDRVALSNSRKKAVEESTVLLSALEEQVHQLGKSQPYQMKDWHTDLQRLLPPFIALRKKGLFADDWKLFARCERIHST